MFDAQILIAPVIAIDGVFSVFSPWMPREGDNATFLLEVLSETMTSSSTFTVEIWTKKAEESGDGTKATASKVYTAGTDVPGVFDFPARATDATAMEELVRYRFVFNDDVQTGDWILFRMLAPSWYDSVLASTTP